MDPLVFFLTMAGDVGQDQMEVSQVMGVPLQGGAP